MDAWREERIAWAEGYACLAGIDEAGRGAWAGPVVAACVVLPFEIAPSGVADSKTLSPPQRERRYAEIVRVARGVGVGVVSEEVIDEINILQATYQAMRLALANLPAGLFPDLALIDGYPVKPFPIAQTALIDGDARCLSIAAASIIAKVTRDRLMQEAAARFPGYGFAENKGYGAPAHRRALETLGVCEIHRKTYRPVQKAMLLRADSLPSENNETPSHVHAKPASQTARRERRTHRKNAS